jgi:uncharacterized protein YdaU (DUF1376 family)
MIIVRRIDFYADDWLAGTRGMSFAEAGAYWQICSVIYAKDGPVPVADLRRILKGRGFERLFHKLVAIGKVQLSGGFVSVSRALRELERSHNRTQQAHEASGNRWKTKTNGHASGDFSAYANNLQSAKENPSSSVVPSAARASSLDGGATHAHDDENGAWKKAGNAFPLAAAPPPPTPDKVKRAGEHYFFLLNQRPGEAERYLDSLDPISQLPPDEIFNAVEARMRA